MARRSSAYVNRRSIKMNAAHPAADQLPRRWVHLLLFSGGVEQLAPSLGVLSESHFNFNDVITDSPARGKKKRKKKKKSSPACPEEVPPLPGERLRVLLRAGREPGERRGGALESRRGSRGCLFRALTLLLFLVWLVCATFFRRCFGAAVRGALFLSLARLASSPRRFCSAGALPLAKTNRHSWDTATCSGTVSDGGND